MKSDYVLVKRPREQGGYEIATPDGEVLGTVYIGYYNIWSARSWDRKRRVIGTSRREAIQRFMEGM